MDQLNSKIWSSLQVYRDSTAGLEQVWLRRTQTTFACSRLCSQALRFHWTRTDVDGLWRDSSSGSFSGSDAHLRWPRVQPVTPPCPNSDNFTTALSRGEAGGSQRPRPPRSPRHPTAVPLPFGLPGLGSPRGGSPERSRQQPSVVLGHEQVDQARASLRVQFPSRPAACGPTHAPLDDRKVSDGSSLTRCSRAPRDLKVTNP